MKMLRAIHFLGLATTLISAPAHAATGTLGEPVTWRNLQVFPVHGDAQLEDRRYATLSEAMAKRFVVVEETGNVQELSIENLSKTTTVFLNAGDIVKGGRQDRTVRDDLILPPRSGKVPLATFCVESGRWTKRGAEDSGAFSANTKVLTSRKLKMAARYGQSQSEVWSGVAEQQSRLNANVSSFAGKPVDTRSASSESSLQLTLENKELEQVRKEYLDKLSPAFSGKTDVLGFVYVINGEINSAEIYNNKTLFHALWPRLLEAAVTEAIAEYRPGREPQKLQATAVKAFFETAVSGSSKERQVWKSTRVKICSTDTTVLFITQDVDAGNAWIHKSFINKGKETVVVPLDLDGPAQQLNAPVSPSYRR